MFCHQPQQIPRVESDISNTVVGGKNINHRKRNAGGEKQNRIFQIPSPQSLNFSIPLQLEIKQ